MKFLNNFLFHFNITEKFTKSKSASKTLSFDTKYNIFQLQIKISTFKRFQLQNFEFRLLNFFLSKLEIYALYLSYVIWVILVNYHIH